MSTLEENVRTLQKQVRRQRRWNIGLGLMVVVGGLMAAKGVTEAPDVVQAKKFEVVNDEGEILVRIGGRTFGGFLSLYNMAGKPIATLSTSPRGGAISINDNSAKPNVLILADRDGGNVGIFGNGRGLVTSLGVDHTSGIGVIKILDSEGQMTERLLPGLSE